MTPRTRSLLDAADSRRRTSEPEDRLTEILREVFMTAPLLASWLVAKAFGMPASEAKKCCAYRDYEVDTQFALRDGGRPDMRFHFVGKHPSPGKLFCENKIRAGWTAWQSRGYPSVPQSGRIVVLSPEGRLPPELPSEERPKFVPLSWTDLAQEADRIGRSWEGLDWRTNAVGPDAPGQYRMLAELLWYLEREDVNVNLTRPITADDLGVLPNVSVARARWKQFRDLVLTELQKNHTAPIEVDKRWDLPEFRNSESLAVRVAWRRGPGWEGAQWPAISDALEPPKESWHELILSPHAPWMDQDAPFIAAGVGLRKLPDWSDDTNEWSRLLEAIQGAGAWHGFTEREKVYRVLMPGRLEEIISPDETLQAQAEKAVTWALDALHRLLGLEPAR